MFFLVVFPISVVFILVLQLPHWQSENNDDELFHEHDKLLFAKGPE